MLEHLPPVLFAVAVWWSGTALVLGAGGLEGRPAWLVAWAVLLPSALGALLLRDEASVAAAYAGFLCGVGAWAAQEILFLAGALTGPNRAPLPAGTAGLARFRAAFGAVSHHEAALVAIAALLWALGSTVALHTFLLLWAMRQSAKLNLFLGCRNWGEAMLPARLAHMSSFFRRRRMNALFPFSVAGGAAATWWLLHLAARGDAHDLAAFTLLAAMMALAVIEHMFLMLPVALDGLWTRGQHAAPRAGLPEAAANGRARP